VAQYEELIEISCDVTSKIKFCELSLCDFWIATLQTQPNVATIAVKRLLRFHSTYMCEAGFSRYASTKTKSRNKLDAEPQVRCQLTNIKPDIEALCSKHQAQKAH
jgi:hypothetical protein